MKKIFLWLLLLTQSGYASNEVCHQLIDKTLEAIQLNASSELSAEHLDAITHFITSANQMSLMTQGFNDAELNLVAQFLLSNQLMACKSLLTKTTQGFPQVGIEGHVTAAANGSDITTGQVLIFDSNNTFMGFSQIDEVGYYHFSGLTAGSYYATTNNTGFFDELWNDLPCPQGNCDATSGTPIVFNDVNVTADFALNIGATISGNVQDQNTGNNITSGQVVIYDDAGDQLGIVQIDELGNYQYSGLDNGSYYTQTQDTGYIDEVWMKLSCPYSQCGVTKGSAIVVNNNNPVADFQLLVGGSITGQVTESAQGTSITEGAVNLYDASGIYWGFDTIDTKGTYHLYGLTAGNYLVSTTNTGYQDEVWDNITCINGACTITDGSAIAVNNNTQVADFELVAGGSILGSVKEAGSNNLITQGAAFLYDAAGTYQDFANIDEQGLFLFEGLTNGTYYVRTDNTGYIDELWDDIYCDQQQCQILSGTPITFTGNVQSATIDFQLQSGTNDFIFANGFD